MNRLRVCASAVFAVIVVGGANGCRGSRENDFWQAPATYDLVLQVTDRPARLPNLPVPSTDSLHVAIMVDSLRGDSVFGRYKAHFDSLGVPVGDMGLSPAFISGRIERDSFTLVLAPNVIDAELVAGGTVVGGQAAGTWHRISPLPYRGRFQIRRSKM